MASNPDIYADLKNLVAMQHQASGFSFLPRQAVHSILSGRHASRLRGRGLNFEELRHYRSGDDIRTMDWKVTNRTRKPHVRVFTEEKDRPVLLVVDQRIGMFFGSRLRMKSVTAAEITALAAWRVLSVGDRVGALLFNDAEIVETRPLRSRNTVMQILRNLLRLNHMLSSDYAVPGNRNQLNLALRGAERLCGHDYLVVIISDMSGWNQESVMRVKRLARHNDVIASLVYDPLEQALPDTSQLVLSDGEMQIEINPEKSGLKSRYAVSFEETVEGIRQELRRHDVPVIPVSTDAPTLDQLREAVGARAGGRRR